MTKEQAILGLRFLQNSCESDEDTEIFTMAIKALEQQPSDDEITITMKKGTLKYSGHEYVVYNKDWFRKHFATEINIMTGYDEYIEQPTSEDCVSRKRIKQIVSNITAEYDTETIHIDRLMDEIDDLPPVTPTQRWIPVSERLPEDRNIVLVTAYWHETYQVMMASYFGEGLWWCVPFNNCGDHMQKLNPKAWQPLPVLYKEKRGNENGSN